MISESNVSFWIRFSVYRATFSGSNSLKARRYPSRFLSTIDQLSPACAASSTRNSKCWRSSWTGTPHSRSWYASINGLSLPAQVHRLILLSVTAQSSAKGADRVSAVPLQGEHQLPNQYARDRRGQGR